jgi:hypothetical protein
MLFGELEPSERLLKMTSFPADYVIGARKIPRPIAVDKCSNKI